jgi:hypothetical protein
MTVPQGKLLTTCVMGLISILAVAYDAWIIRTVGPDASISRVLSGLLADQTAFLMIVFWLGFFLGHIYAPSR